jgi:MFS family permease
VLPYLVKELMLHLTLPQTFRVLGGISAVVLFPSVMVLKPRVTVSSRHSVAGSRPKRALFDFALFEDGRFVILLVTSSVAMIGFLPHFFLLRRSAVAQGVSETFVSWLLGLMNGFSIVGRIGIGWLADRYGKVTTLSWSFILCGTGHFLFWPLGVVVSAESSSTTTVLFTRFPIYTGVFGSGFLSLFPVVVADSFGAEALASKVGLLNTLSGLGTLSGSSLFVL